MKLMKWYFIYTYPATYGGLHGMYDYDLVGCSDFQEACDVGHEMACETVERYLRADEILSQEEFMDLYYESEEWDDQYETEYWDAVAEAIEDEACFDIYLLDDEYTYEDYLNWQKKNLEPEDFIKRYCRQITQIDI